MPGLPPHTIGTSSTGAGLSGRPASSAPATSPGSLASVTAPRSISDGDSPGRAPSLSASTRDGAGDAKRTIFCGAPLGPARSTDLELPTPIPVVAGHTCGLAALRKLAFQYASPSLVFIMPFSRVRVCRGGGNCIETCQFQPESRSVGSGAGDKVDQEDSMCSA